MKELEEIGRGTFGIVIRCETNSGQQVARKTLNVSEFIDVDYDQIKQRFCREVRLLQGIQHPNIVSILDFDLDSEPPWFTMQLADCTLKDLIDQGRLEDELKKKALFDILAGLDVLASNGVKHRDLKPGNVLCIDLGEEHLFQISDFGLGAIESDDASTLTATGMQGGTQNYAAPELVKSFRRATLASDIYSFGAILHDLYVGTTRIPYSRLYGPGAIGRVIQKCTDPVPRARYSSISDLRTDLYVALSGDLELATSSPNADFIKEKLNQDELEPEEWDEIFVRIEEMDNDKSFESSVILALNKVHLDNLSSSHPDLIVAYAHYLINYCIETESALPFDFCDVLCTRMLVVSKLGDVEVKALIALGLLVMGVSHNRFYVERRVLEIFGQSSGEEMIERFRVEAQARGIDFADYIVRLVGSLGLEPDAIDARLRTS